MERDLRRPRVAVFPQLLKKLHCADTMVVYTDEEEWRIIPGHETHEVSSHGRLRTIWTGYITLGSSVGGYMMTYLRKYMHVLVALTFIGPRPSPIHTVDHINRIPGDNHVSNLRWATPKEQVNNRNPSTTQSKALMCPVVQSNLDGTFVARFDSVKDALKAIRGTAQTLYGALKGRNHTAGGFLWEYEYVTIEGEVWKEYEGVPVSNMGRVKKANGTIGYGGINGLYGYRNTRVNGKPIQVHTLVALLFIGPQPSSEHTVDHINRITNDNKASNLRWATKVEQRRNQTRTVKGVVQTDLDDNVVATYLSARSASVIRR